MGAGEKRHSESLVLIDTSVWKEYFRKEEKVFSRINALLDAGRVCSLNFVIGELIAEATTEEEKKACQDFQGIFPVLPEPGDAWIAAAAWVRKMQKRGQKVTLRDAYIAWVAKTHKVQLWTRNLGFSSPGKASIPGLKFFLDSGV